MLPGVAAKVPERLRPAGLRYPGVKRSRPSCITRRSAISRECRPLPFGKRVNLLQAVIESARWSRRASRSRGLDPAGGNGAASCSPSRDRHLSVECHGSHHWALGRLFSLPGKPTDGTRPRLFNPYTGGCGIRRCVRCIPTNMVEILTHLLQVEFVLGKVA